MPGTAFDGSTWVTGAQVGALALGSVASVAVSAALVRKAALEEATRDTRRRGKKPTTNRRERVRLSNRKNAHKLERNAKDEKEGEGTDQVDLETKEQ